MSDPLAGIDVKMIVNMSREEYAVLKKRNADFVKCAKVEKPSEPLLMKMENAANSNCTKDQLQEMGFSDLAIKFILAYRLYN